MTLFLRLLDETDKSAALDMALANIRSGVEEPRAFEVDPEEFGMVPGAPFAYWVSTEVRGFFESFSRLQIPGAREACFGLSTKDDTRFLRLTWEISRTGPSVWKPIVKGGSFSPYYSDVHLLIKWTSDATELKRFAERRTQEIFGSPSWSRWINSVEHYFRPGLTWPRRSQRGLSIRALSSGCVFADKGPSIFVNGDDRTMLLDLLGLSNSLPFHRLIALQMAFGSYEVGVIQKTPVPEFGSNALPLAELAHRAWSLKRSLDTATETSHAFWLPALVQVEGVTLEARTIAWENKVALTAQELTHIQAKIDDIAFELYAISEDDRRAMEQVATVGVTSESETEDEADDDESEDSVISDPSMLVSQILSWSVGVAFKRWDLRCATGERQSLPEPDPFDPLPAHAPGSLNDGCPLEWLLDDRGDHDHDLVSQVEGILASLQGSRESVDWAGESCRILGVRELRDWFNRKFFDLHLKAYSKSRRKAPIYWPLSIPSGRFTVWLYAPAVHKDSLWRVLKEVVEPRIELETRRYWELKGEAGESPSRDQQNQIDALDAFVQELKVMGAELARVAPLWNPNLDDGIVLNCAMLYRFFQHAGWRKECESKWRDLEALKYPWAHVSMHLWPEKVLPLCHRDRSLAIAHDLEQDLWAQDEDDNWKPRDLTDSEIQSLLARFKVASVSSALHAFGAARLDPQTAPARKAKASPVRKSKASKDDQLGLEMI